MGFSFKKAYSRVKKKVVGAVAKVDPLVGMYRARKDAKKGDGDAYRSEAAKKVLKGVNRQAGSGQVRYTTETYE